MDKLAVERVTRTQITSFKRLEMPIVDPIALREAVINAFVHNDFSTEIPPLIEMYADRWGVTSAGSLPQNLTLEEFYSGISAPRNKQLMRVFKDLRIVEQLGSGMQRILRV